MKIQTASVILRLLAVLFALEGLTIGAVLVVLLVDLATVKPTSVSSALVLVLLAALGVVWAALLVVGILRGRQAARSAGVVWQVLQLAVGASSLTGVGGQPLIGIPLISVALLALVLLFTPAVVRASLARGEQPGDG